ncbi:MAG: OmpH family outer membrane protein [Bacteroidetes bacterium]|nr:OmpH family outer membrane protein [Bacteroidota bacterium]
MKNISVVLNVVLLVAVGALYFIHFSSSPSATAPAGPSGDGLKIAYIQADTVLKHYDYLKAEQEKFDDKGKKIEQDMKNRAQSLQTEIQAYQQNVNNMTIGQAKAVEEDLGKKQQNFELYRERATQELMAEQDKLNKALYDKVTAFLKDYGTKNGYHVVLKYNTASDVLFASEGLDISRQVIEGLNDEYRKESGKLKTPEKK